MVGALLIGTLMAWFWGAAVVVSFVLCIALSPALVWACGGLLRGSGTTVIWGYYGMSGIFDSWVDTRDDLAAQAASQSQVVYVHGPKLTPRYGLLLGVAMVAALLVAGGVFAFVRARGI